MLCTSHTLQRGHKRVLTNTRQKSEVKKVSNTSRKAYLMCIYIYIPMSKFTL